MIYMICAIPAALYARRLGYKAAILSAWAASFSGASRFIPLSQSKLTAIS